MDILPAVTDLIAPDTVDENGIRKDPAAHGYITLPAQRLVRQLIFAQKAGIDKQLCIGVRFLTDRVQAKQIARSQGGDGEVIIAPTDTFYTVAPGDTAVWAQIKDTPVKPVVHNLQIFLGSETQPGGELGFHTQPGKWRELPVGDDLLQFQRFTFKYSLSAELPFIMKMTKGDLCIVFRLQDG